MSATASRMQPVKGSALHDHRPELRFQHSTIRTKDDSETDEQDDEQKRDVDSGYHDESDEADAGSSDEDESEAGEEGEEEEGDEEQAEGENVKTWPTKVPPPPSQDFHSIGTQYTQPMPQGIAGYRYPGQARPRPQYRDTVSQAGGFPNGLSQHRPHQHQAPSSVYQHMHQAHCHPPSPHTHRQRPEDTRNSSTPHRQLTGAWHYH